MDAAGRDAPLRARRILARSDEHGGFACRQRRGPYRSTGKCLPRHLASVGSLPARTTDNEPRPHTAVPIRKHRRVGFGPDVLYDLRKRSFCGWASGGVEGLNSRRLLVSQDRCRDTIHLTAG
jgi:hypothetical protein